MQEKKKQSLPKKEAKLKAASFCAYQERSQKEVRSKLYDYGLYTDEVEEVLTELILEGFINEERFARQYVGGKFRMKKWGKNRILLGLKQHDISAYCVKAGMREIDDVAYLNTLDELINKKANVESDPNLLKRRNKIARHLMYKGYEPELVWDRLKELVN